MKLVRLGALAVSSCFSAGCAAGGSVQGVNDSTSSSRASRSSAVIATSITYPVYATLYQHTNNPFLMTFNALVSVGAFQPPNAATMSNNLWNQGAGKYQTVGALPLYEGQSSYTTYVISCNAYSSGGPKPPPPLTQQGCSAQGVSVHLPSGWVPQSGTDRHVTAIDIPGGHEDDMWGGYNNGSYTGPEQCNVIISGGVNYLNCSWGGDYKFSTKGLQSTNNNGSGVAAGFAEGLFELTAGDLLGSGPIQHALGVNTECLDNDLSEHTAGAVYPSSRTAGSDQTCAGSGLPSPAPPYGAMWHLKNSVNVAGLGYGTYCAKIVQAMQTYGMYTMDTGNVQVQLEVENPIVYSHAPYSSNPFYTTIWPSMVSAGDGTGTGANFSFGSCFNRLTASDFEVYYAPVALGF